MDRDDGRAMFPERGHLPRRKQIDRVLAAVRAGDPSPLSETILTLHPADIADFLEQIRRDDRRAVFEMVADTTKGAVLWELDEALREAERAHAERALRYPEGSAGRLMQQELVALPEDWTVGEAIDEMRRRTDLPEDFFHVVLIDPGRRPTGLVRLGRILGAHRAVALEDLKNPTLRTFPVDMPEENVAYAFAQYHAHSVPVVEADGTLAGIVTVDDAMVALDEAHDEDMLKLGGVSEDSQLSDTVGVTVRRRLPWLGVATVNSIIVALTISVFEDAIDQIVALAILMPMVAAIGGAAGTQALTVAVRGLATHDLTVANRLRVIGREALTGMLNGLILAIVVGTIAILWFDVDGLGPVVGLAMAITVATAGMTGICVPLVLDRLGFDPALASGTFVTTLIDVLGFFTFLWLATVVLL